MSRCRRCMYVTDDLGIPRRISTDKTCSAHGTPRGILLMEHYIDPDGADWYWQAENERWIYKEPIGPYIGEGYLYRFLSYEEMADKIMSEKE